MSDIVKLEYNNTKLKYDPTHWRNGQEPPINATNLNKIEGAIKNNSSELDKVIPKINEVVERANTNTTSITNLEQSVSNTYATKTDVETTLTSYATKLWVNDQKFLTEHQSLDNYVTTDDLETHTNTMAKTLEDYAKKDDIPDVSNFIETTEVQTTYATKEFVSAELEKINSNEVDLSDYVKETDLTQKVEDVISNMDISVEEHIDTYTVENRRLTLNLNWS